MIRPEPAACSQSLDEDLDDSKEVKGGTNIRLDLTKSRDDNVNGDGIETVTAIAIESFEKTPIEAEDNHCIIKD